jgi:ABC-type uncharacterized transport system permease subunit
MRKLVGLGDAREILNYIAIYFLCLFVHYIIDTAVSYDRSIASSKSSSAQIHSFFEIKFCSESNLVLPHPSSSKFVFLYGHPLAAKVFFLVFPRSFL